jgi:allantoin racemase
MKIHVINPNTTASMTAKIDRCARAALGAAAGFGDPRGPGSGDPRGPGIGSPVEIRTTNPPAGPASIESHFDEALCLPGLLAEIRRSEQAGTDAYVIACFGDPGLLAAREIARGSVVGIAEAAMRTAAYLGRTFSVVTTLDRTIGQSIDLVQAYGLQRQCAGIHGSGASVADLETDPEAYGRVLQSCRDAVRTDRCDALVLGCAGMADLCAAISAELGVPVVDGVAAAVQTARSLVELGLTTGKAGEFAAPPAKSYPGVDWLEPRIPEPAA